MKSKLTFWRNVMVIATIHIVVLAGLARWSGSAKTPPLTDVVWVQTGNGPSLGASLIEESQPTEEATPPPMEDPLTMRTPPPGEIDDSTPTPQPTSTPRPTPKPTPKKAIAQTTPKTKPAAKKVAAKKASAQPSGGESSGSDSQAGAASEFNWYGNMLHDRFHGAWVQPTTASSTGAKMSALVQLRIEKDGRVSNFELARSSGNVVVDESVRAVAQKVTRVDPPPTTLAPGGHYDVRINFELDVE